MVDRFVVDLRSAGLGTSTLALLEFADKLTNTPAAVDTSDVATLRRHGFDDPAISSVTQVVAYFSYINRVAEGLGVPSEDWLEADGKPKKV